jgi:Regulator of chromosome condensation (RCC1) repeat
VSAVAAGYDHNLALKADGTVWAWGENSSGQLGDGTTTHRYYPAQVKGLGSMDAIAAGNEGSLALTFAKEPSGIGDGLGLMPLLPFKVRSYWPSLTNIACMSFV